MNILWENVHVCLRCNTNQPEYNNGQNDSSYGNTSAAFVLEDIVIDESIVDNSNENDYNFDLEIDTRLVFTNLYYKISWLMKKNTLKKVNRITFIYIIGMRQNNSKELTNQ